MAMDTGIWNDMGNRRGPSGWLGGIDFAGLYAYMFVCVGGLI